MVEILLSKAVSPHVAHSKIAQSFLYHLDFLYSRAYLDHAICQRDPRHYIAARQEEIIRGPPCDRLNERKTHTAGTAFRAEHRTIVNAVSDERHSVIKKVRHKDLVQALFLSSLYRDELYKCRSGIHMKPLMRFALCRNHPEVTRPVVLKHRATQHSLEHSSLRSEQGFGSTNHTLWPMKPAPRIAKILAE